MLSRSKIQSNRRLLWIFLSRTGRPQRNSSQIVVFFGLFNRPGSSATSNNSASTSDNGDKISQMSNKGFCRVCRAARLRSTKEKKTSPSLVFNSENTFQKFVKSIHWPKSSQIRAILSREPFRSFRVKFF